MTVTPEWWWLTPGLLSQKRHKWVFRPPPAFQRHGPTPLLFFSHFHPFKIPYKHCISSSVFLSRWLWLPVCHYSKMVLSNIIIITTIKVRTQRVEVAIGKRGNILLSLSKLRSSNICPMRSHIPIIHQNLLIVLSAFLSFWFLGYAFAFGEGHGMGSTNFLATGSPGNIPLHFLLQWFLVSLFCIVSSCGLSERVQLWVHAVFPVLFAIVVYPFLAHCWAGNSLSLSLFFISLCVYVCVCFFYFYFFI